MDNNKGLLSSHKEIIIAVIIGLSLIGYAMITRQTKLETLEREMEQENTKKLEEKTRIEDEERDRTLKLNRCLLEADDNFWSAWKLNCSSEIVKDKDGEIESCSVYNSIGEGLKTQKQKDKDRCVDLYK